MSQERIAALDALGMVWNRADESWERGLAAARSYHDEHRDLRVPVSFVGKDGFKLGAWISRQRTDRARGSLSPERIAALDALDIAWDAREASWRRGIAAARAYREVHGDLMVPVSLIADDGFTLGRWIFTRRRQRRMGALSPERVAALDDLDMIWDPLVEGWERPLAAAYDYRQLHGHLRVPTAYETDDGLRLGGWITEQRGRRRRGQLSSERIAALDALGMNWDARGENWERGIDASRNYRDQYGDLRIPQAFVTDDGFKLGAWISQKRTDRKSGKLSPERLAALDALGMIWNRGEDSWQRGIAAATSYREQQGDLRVPDSFVTRDGLKLGGWINQRRMDRSRGKLSRERIAALDALGMAWDAHDDSWQRGIAVARAYRKEHDHLRVPAKYVTEDGFALGAWISTKRGDRARGKLSTQRVSALDALGMTWDLQQDDWERGITAARAYREAHDHLRVPAKYVTTDRFALGGWIWMRRADRARGKLSADRIAALDALGMTWDPREDDWQRGIDAARAYRETYGDLRVPQSFIDDFGFRLGRWIANRRTGRKRGVLSPDRIATLDALDMVW